MFPWDQRAEDGALFSRSFVPRPTGRGRFDLPLGVSATLYLAETPEHAVSEALQPWRGRSIDGRHLQRAGLPLALVRARVTAPTEAIADLCAPSTLASLSIPPDRLASRYRSVTQPLAKLVWDRGHAGLRWWSTFWGDWHGVVLFAERLRDGVGLAFDEPEPLVPDTPALTDAARLLAMEVRA